MPRSPFILALLIASAVFAQQTFTERIEVSAIDVPIVVRDASGKTPPDLKPSDFILTEDGVEQEIIGLAYPRGGQAPPPVLPSSAEPRTGEAPVLQGKPWQIVVFLQQSLSSSHGLKTALEAVSAHAEELTALGPVEVVGDAGGTPKRLIEPISDGKQLSEAMRTLASKIRGSDEIVRLRTEYIADIGFANSNANRAVATARLEAMIIRARQNALVNWLSRYGEADRPRALVFLTNGYDTEPRDFYNVADTGAVMQLQELSTGPLQREMSQAIAAAGWTVLSFAPGWMESAQSPTFDVSNSGRGRLNAFKAGQNMDSITAVSINIHPMDPLQTMADATGGAVLTNPRKLGGEISTLGDRLVLTYQLHRRRDGKVHRIEVKSRRPGLTIRAQDFIVTGTPEAFAVARASSLATVGGDQGELPVSCTFGKTSTGSGDEMTSEVEVVVSLAPLEAIRASLTDTTLRFSVAVQTPDAPPVTVSRRFENLDLSKERGWKVTFQVRHRPGASAGVVAEEVATGVWGGCTCEQTVGAESQVANEQRPMGWPNIPNASAAARRSGRLMLLYVRSGIAKVDKPAEEWLAAASKEESVAFAMKQYVLASATQDALVKTADPGKPHVLVVDGHGGSIVELEAAFRSAPQFGRDLLALAQQTSRLNQAAQLRNAGETMNATILTGQALLDAGFDAAARDDLELGVTVGQATADPEAMQRARIGIASIDLKTGRTSNALDMIKELLDQPASPEIATAAWLLRGHALRGQRKTGAAIEAYQHAYELAEKPSSYAEAARRFLETLGSAPKSETQVPATAGTVRILYPHRVSLTGSVEFAVVAPAGTARVEYYVDDARVAEKDRQPFRANLPLGTTPRVHNIRAVAFSKDDTILGEHTETVNDVVAAVDVEIVQPRSGVVESRAMVEVEARAPQGRKVTAVELYWNERSVGSLTAPPYRFELVLPAPSASGYIRAVARDDSGETAEDVRLINSEGVAEEVRVDAVQLFAIVEDRNGRGIEGLTARDFVVKEEGVPMNVNIDSTSSDPISIGLALDTSSSMQTIITDVIDYGQRFVKEALRDGDKSFLVEFDEQPRVVQPLTTSKESLSKAIYGIRAVGATALWDSIVYSLRQFQGVPGKRALVVFTDGDNTEGTMTPRGATEYAHEVGVPVYIVEMFTGMQQTAGLRHKNMSESLREIATSTGGQYFQFIRKKDLPRIFEQIRNDTRGEYLLTYVSPSATPGLRKVSVTVAKKKATVRAPRAYYRR